MITITYEEISEILLVTLSKDIDTKEIVESFEIMKHIDKEIPCLKVIVDSTNCRIFHNMKDLKVISSTFEGYAKEFKKVKQALLVTNPFLTAVGTLLIQDVAASKIQTKIFSTKEAALEWLNIS